VSQLTFHDSRVRAAMKAVRREDFLPPELRHAAPIDSPIAIGHGQTTSQPSLVGLMLQELKLTADSTVLEIGTGCGYQTALLAHLAKSVSSIDIVAELAAGAQARLAGRYANVEIRAGDGYQGWPEAAPFDAIIVAAGASRIPLPLLEQLRLGGRLLIPLETSRAMDLMLVTRVTPDEYLQKKLLDVVFVPLTGRDAQVDRRRRRSGFASA
jgi:protein-L-isoaspartate(D-aspartate) O-methyltransferase